MQDQDIFNYSVLTLCKFQVYDILYTSHINSLNMADFQPNVAAICNWYSEFVHKWKIFLLLLCILEVEWGYGTIKMCSSL